MQEPFQDICLYLEFHFNVLLPYCNIQNACSSLFLQQCIVFPFPCILANITILDNFMVILVRIFIFQIAEYFVSLFGFPLTIIICSYSLSIFCGLILHFLVDFWRFQKYSVYEFGYLCLLCLLLQCWLCVFIDYTLLILM